MIYARFWVKVLNDVGLLGFREPFAQFFSNGWVTMGKAKMSKRAWHIVGPDQFIELYGADACRLNILFLGPGERGHGVDGGGASRPCRGSFDACGRIVSEVGGTRYRPASR